MKEPLTKLKWSKYLIIAVAGFLIPLILVSTSSAEEGLANCVEKVCSKKVLDDISKSPECLIYLINNLWVLIAGILVFAMQLGFAMLEAGFSPAKNTVNVLFKNVADVCLGIVVFFLFGYALMYHPATSSDPNVIVIPGVLGLSSSYVALKDLLPREEAKHLSVYIDFFFQAAFAATSATICSGAVAGRIKPWVYLLLTVIITGLVYPISGSWVWGGGRLDTLGFHDFAGSLVVHSVGGAAALACVIILGPRKGRFDGRGQLSPREDSELKPHSLPLAAMGTFILWLGWYGFNAGSTLDGFSPNSVGKIVLNTNLAGCASALTVIAWRWFNNARKVDLSTILNGILGGLVGITASSDVVEPFQSLIIGIVSGVIVILGIDLLSNIKIDDAVGAIPVHCFCGIWGGLATGVFAQGIEGIDFVTQLLGSFLIPFWSFIVVFLVLKGLDYRFGIRVSPEKENYGLDWQEHGEIAYLSLEKND
ncbi:ammonium transporter [Moorena producens]|uniref:ammonium transporter n=1 Tax=Moorena producens TaxID=1155739 RepID=UPI003C72AFC6